VNRPMPGNDIRNHFGLPEVLQRLKCVHVVATTRSAKTSEKW
jgi:hypothetical protein